MATRDLVLAIAVAIPGVASGSEVARAPVYFAVSVPNLEASVKWYADVLGLTPVVSPPAATSAAAARIVVLSGPGLLVELIQPAGGFPEEDRRPPRERHLSRGIAKVGFHVDDLDATVARVQKRGGRVMGSAYSDERVGVRSVLVLDNDDNLIQLFEPLVRK